MAFSNNQSNYYVNTNFPFENQSYFNGESSNYSNYTNHQQQQSSSGINIRYSNLEPTAQEFHPSSTNTNNGAVKRKPNQYNRQKDSWRYKNNRYGSGRTFNGSRVDHKYGSKSSEDYSKVVQDTNSSRDIKYDNIERSRSDNLLEFQNINHSDLKPEVSNEEHFENPRPNVYYESQRSYESPTRSIRSNGRNDKQFRNSYKSEKTNYNNGYDKFRKGNNFQDKYNRSNTYEEYERGSYADSRQKFSYKSNSNNDKFTVNHSNYNEHKNHTQESRDSGYQQFKPGFRSHNKNNERFDGRITKDWRDNNTRSRKKFDAASQRERLEEMINRRLLECLVCCDKIKNSDKVWSCALCYHIIHLNCVVAWAKSSKVENGWRCPACQNVCSEVPDKYKCYCGKRIEPRYDANFISHSCGEMCLRKGRTCEHKCTLLCHPGPCPDCTIMVEKPCGCGSTKPLVKCSTDIEIVCENTCNKILECGIHKCKLNCHSGDCSLCEEVIRQECFCGKVGRKVPCRAEYNGQLHYECGEECGKLLTCGNHTCKKLCHDGPCETCSRDVDQIHSCPCGRTKLEKPRTSCLDPIPCCDKICGKVLKCGQPSSPHICKKRCHEGDCPPCPSTTVVRCRCGHMDKELPCQKLTTKADDARCEKKCTKKRLCGKHKCNQRCCIEIEHICPLPCNHQLSCGQHRCERTCHSGRCPPCMETSFEELFCECGNSVIYPPIPCGTKPPSCNNPCSRQRPCGHDVNHNCHTGNCPPCTVLCKRWCFGHHEQRSAIPCHQENFSCGLPCGKAMPCGRHKCVKPCHEGPCPLPCKQPCTVPRILCGHPCGRPCHDPPCPESSCKQNVPVTCPCGVQKAVKPCTEVSEEFRNIQMSQLKDKMGSLSKEQTVDISDIVTNTKKPSVLKILECTEECRVLERNRRLAIGLQIVNPDISQKLTPRYSDFMRQWAKKDSNFCQRVHDRLTELVQLAKQSKQKSRSYSFESMNRDKRHFIHEYCEHFGVDSEAYDMEPNRNVVATAIKDKSWLPGMSLLEVIQRENGQRKVPGPVSVLGRNTISKPETVSLKLPSRIQRSSTPPGELVDYFNAPP